MQRSLLQPHWVWVSWSAQPGLGVSAAPGSALQHHLPPPPLTLAAGKVEASSSGATALICSQGSACRLSTGYLCKLQVKLQPIVNLLPDKGRFMDFLLQRRSARSSCLCARRVSRGGVASASSLIP